MTSEYEKQRQLNITKNKALLNGLSLAKPEEEQIRSNRSTARPLKRQKVEAALPSRTSSRLSQQARPSYVDEHLPKVRSVSTPKTKFAPSNPKVLTETEVQEIVQRWAWQATADPPTRDENSTLHFNDYPDVPSTFTHSNRSSHQILPQKRFSVKVPLEDPITVPSIPKLFQ